MASLKEYRLEQLEKLAKLQDLGINPYPAQAQRDQTLTEIKNNFAQFEIKQYL